MEQKQNTKPMEKKQSQITDEIEDEFNAEEWTILNMFGTDKKQKPYVASEPDTAAKIIKKADQLAVVKDFPIEQDVEDQMVKLQGVQLTTVERTVIKNALRSGGMLQLDETNTDKTYFSYDVGAFGVRDMQTKHNTKMGDYVPQTAYAAFSHMEYPTTKLVASHLGDAMRAYPGFIQKIGFQGNITDYLKRRVGLSKKPMCFVLSGTAVVKVLDGTMAMVQENLIQPSIYTQYSRQGPDYKTLNQLGRMIESSPLNSKIITQQQMADDIQHLETLKFSNGSLVSQIGRLNKIGNVLHEVYTRSLSFWEQLQIRPPHKVLLNAFNKMGLLYVDKKLVIIEPEDHAFLGKSYVGQTFDDFVMKNAFNFPINAMDLNVQTLLAIGQDTLKKQMVFDGKPIDYNYVYNLDQKLYINPSAGAGPCFKTHKQLEVAGDILFVATLYNYIDVPVDQYTPEMKTFATDHSLYFDDKLKLLQTTKHILIQSGRTTYLKGKNEVQNIEKTVRNINSVNISAFYPAAELFDTLMTQWKAFPITSQLLTFKLFKGGFHALFQHCVQQSYTKKCYSDNIYYFNGEDWFSLDISSMECSHTTSSVKLCLATFLKTYHNTNIQVKVSEPPGSTSVQHMQVQVEQEKPDKRTTYMLQVFPHMSVDVIGIIGNLQLQCCGWASGAFGTHVVNTFCTQCGLWVLDQSISYNDFYNEDTKTLQPWIIEIFAVVAGILVKCESVVKNFKQKFNDNMKDPQPNVLLHVDMLGFDGTFFSVGGVTRFIPVLQLSRLIAAMYFQKFRNNIPRIVQAAVNDAKLFSKFTQEEKDSLYQCTGNLIRLLKARQLFIIGGWFHRPQQLRYMCQSALIGLTTSREQLKQFEVLHPEILAKICQMAQSEVAHDLSASDKEPSGMDVLDPVIAMPCMLDVLLVCSDAIHVNALLQHTTQQYTKGKIQLGELVYFIGHKNVPMELIDEVQDQMVQRLDEINVIRTDTNQGAPQLTLQQLILLKDKYQPMTWTKGDKKLQEKFRQRVENMQQLDDDRRLAFIEDKLTNKQLITGPYNALKNMTNKIIKISEVEMVAGTIRDIQYVYNRMSQILQGSKTLSRNFKVFSQQVVIPLKRRVASISNDQMFIDTLQYYIGDLQQKAWLAIKRAFVRADPGIIDKIATAIGEFNSDYQTKRDSVMRSELTIRLIVKELRAGAKDLHIKGSLPKLILAVDESNLAFLIQEELTKALSSISTEISDVILGEDSMLVGYFLLPLTKQKEQVIPFVVHKNETITLPVTLILPTRDTLFNYFCVQHKVRYMVQVYQKIPLKYWTFTHTLTTNQVGAKIPISPTTALAFLWQQSGLPLAVKQKGFTPATHQDFVSIATLLKCLTFHVTPELQVVDVVVPNNEASISSQMDPGQLTELNIHQWFSFNANNNVSNQVTKYQHQLDALRNKLGGQEELKNQMNRYLTTLLSWSVTPERQHALMSDKFLNNMEMIVNILIFRRPLSMLFADNVLNSEDVQQGFKRLRSITLLRKTNEETMKNIKVPEPSLQQINILYQSEGTALMADIQRYRAKWTDLEDDIDEEDEKVMVLQEYEEDDEPEKFKLMKDWS